jgi:methyl-accepting chemotaxis protein
MLIVLLIAIVVLALGALYAVSIAPPAERVLVAGVFIGLAGAGYLIVGALQGHADPVERFYYSVAGGIGGMLLGFGWVSLRRRTWSKVASGGVLSDALRPHHQRKLSNYLLDKNLQLRYILLVTILSALIAGALGYMIYDQRRTASESIERDLQALTQADASRQEFEEHVASVLESDDQALIYKMVAVGFGLVIILSAYLVIMTHKVAGPLFKVSMYFDQMADGRLGAVTPLRRGDMLQDFFGDFKAMHESLRARSQADVAAMEQALTALREARGDAAGAARGQLDEALAALDHHIANRKKQLA